MLDGFFGGFGLGFLFAVAGAGAEAFVVDVDAEGEGFVVVGAFFGDELVGGGFAFVALGELLEVGFGVAPGAGRQDGVDFFEDVLSYELDGGGVALVEVDGADDGFEGVGHDDLVGAAGAALFAAGHADQGEKAEEVGGGADGFGADEGGTPVGEDAFGLVGVFGVEEVGGDELEDSVAEEF